MAPVLFLRLMRLSMVESARGAHPPTLPPSSLKFLCIHPSMTAADLLKDSSALPILDLALASVAWASFTPMTVMALP